MTKRITYIMSFLCFAIQLVLANTKVIPMANVFIDKDSLYTEALSFVKNQQYAQAKDVFIDLLNTDSLSQDDAYYISEAIAYCYQEIGLRDSSSYYFDECVFYPVDKDLMTLPDSLYQSAYNSIHNEDYQSAILSIIQCVDMQITILGNTHYLVGRSKDLLSYAYSLINNYQEAIKYKKDALAIYELYYPKGHSVIIGTQQSLLNLYDYIGDYKNAYAIANSILQIIDNTDSSYLSLRWRISRFLYLSGKFKEAIIYEQETLSLCEMDPTSIMQCKYNICEYYLALGNIQEAFNTIDEAITFCDQKGLTEEEKAIALNLKANLLSITGDYTKALYYGKQSLAIREKLYTTHRDLALSYNNIARYYSFLGLYDESIYFQLKSIAQNIDLGDSISPEMAASYNNLSDYYAQLGKMKEAIDYQTLSLEILDSIFGENHPDYAISLNNLAKLFALNNDLQRAISYGNKVLEIRIQLFGENHSDVAISYGNLSSYHFSNGNYSLAIDNCLKSLSVFEKIVGKNSADYARTLINLASIYLKTKDYHRAIECLRNSQGIYNSLMGDKCPQYIDCCKELAIIYNLIGEDEQSLSLIASISETIRENTLYSISSMSSYERSQFWNKNKTWYYEQLPRLAYRINQPLSNRILYNSILTSKNLLLGADVELEQIINKSEDSELIRRWNQLKNDKAKLNQYYSQVNGHNKSEIDTLVSTIKKDELGIIASAGEYGNFTNSLKVTWKDVRASLSGNEIAIEFVTVPFENDSVLYCALLLKSDYDQPILVNLCDEKSLIEAHDHDMYITNELYNMIWLPLEKYLINVDVIYFAPIGELYNIAFEYAPTNNEKQIMFDCYRMYRISSTRELTTIHKSKELTSVALFGGLNYDVAMEDIKKINIQNNIVQSEIYAERAIVDIDRGKIQYLEGTKEEVIAIAEQLPDSIRKIVYTDEWGTEEAFKNLSGKYLTLLHIDTHGYYWTQSVALMNSLSFLHNIENSSMIDEDRAMSRSGIFFSGANTLLVGGFIPSSMEDGILTAQEVSKLDFHSLDLVVLAACQTGLGDIRGDGVYGLQRGFKKAGAQAILMSLWKVNNMVTTMLMMEFYKNYLGGKSKYDSLKNAQKYIRDFKDEKGNKLFSSPYYWAAFVLLDGL